MLSSQSPASTWPLPDSRLPVTRELALSRVAPVATPADGNVVDAVCDFDDGAVAVPRSGGCENSANRDGGLP
jgi:hypothetical protein